MKQASNSELKLKLFCVCGQVLDSNHGPVGCPRPPNSVTRWLGAEQWLAHHAGGSDGKCLVPFVFNLENMISSCVTSASLIQHVC